MLFINFLCLLYLMVLVNGHTISKSKPNEDDADGIFDSLNEVDHTRRTRLRHEHDRFHKFRRGDTATTTPPLPNKTTPSKVKKPKTTHETTETVKIFETTKPSTISPTSTTLKRGIMAFWKKFKYKKKKDVTAKSIDKCKKPPKSDITLYNAIRDVQRLKQQRRNNNNQLYLEENRRGFKDSNYTLKEKRNRDEISINPYKHYLKTSKYLKTGSMMTADPVNFEDVANKLNAMTTKLTNLKRVYSFDRYRPTESVLARENTAMEENEYPGTAQIEALLNDIKKKAVQILAEQNPIITDIITNTATEATFEADPILTHNPVTSPNYALATFFTINNIDNSLDKRTADAFSSTDNYNDTVFISYMTPRNLRARSIGSEVLTIAQSVEDMLQKELKSAYRKLKHKVSTDLKKEITTVRSTMKKQSKKFMDKVTPKHKYTLKTTTPSMRKTPKMYKLKYSSTPLPTRKEAKTMKMTKKAKSTTFKPVHTTTGTSTYDDFALLTLYEQMLTKAHRNLILMPSNPIFPSRRKRRENVRNPETLTNLRLKENIRRIYDDEEEMPEEMEYAEEPSADATSSNEITAENKIDEKSTTEVKDDEPVTDNSYQGLSNKISYNDYVNGYKHYLKFQKEQGEPQWSNQIKYQAHKHHSVDDIGKFILNKLPHVPVTKRYKRRFFEDTDTIDDQDISTKSHDSWFKKHFYMFLETAPPRKFHNTQTVSLKSPVTSETHAKSEPDRGRLIKKGITEVIDSEEANLDELSKALSIKAATPAMPSGEDISTIDRTVKLRNIKEDSFENNLSVKDIMMSRFFERIFGGNAKQNVTTTKKPGKTTNTAKEYMNEDFLVDLTRYKRGEVKKDHDDTTTDATSSLFRKKHPKKYGYVNIDLIPRSTASLKEQEKKKGKLRRFFSKFRLRKKHRQTTTKKVKRQVPPRIERFNPFKKFKTMFKGSDKKVNPAINVADYDMLTSSIVSFKPVKFSKSPNVDEMRNQVPNITYDFANDLPPLMDKEGWKTTRKSKVNADGADFYSATFSDSSTDFNYTTISRTTTPELRTTSKRYEKTQLASHNYGTSNMEFPQQNFKSTKPTVSTEDIYTTTPPMTLEQMRNEIDNLRLSLSTLDNSAAPAIAGPLKGRKIAINANRPTAPEKFNSIRTIFFTFPMSERTSIYPHYSNTATVRTNVNLRHLAAHKREKPGKQAKLKSMHIDKLRKYEKSKVAENDKATELSAVFDKKVKAVPDYFNDLLMWHRDILERERVGNPTWEAILKSLRDESELTTPDVQALQNEIALMKNYLQTNNEKPKEIQRNNPYSRLLVMPKSKQVVKAKITSEEPRIVAVVTTNKNAKPKDNYFTNGVQRKYPDRSLQAGDLTKFIATVAEINHGEPKRKSFMKTGWTYDDDDISVSSTSGPTAIFVDTTILSYDDAVNYVTTGFETKKLSKYSLPSKTSKIAQPLNKKKSQLKSQPIAKTNKQPVQYFTTPLPMRMYDFERFLKDNNLDVESVTSPLIGLPSFVDLWGGKLGNRDTGVNMAGFKSDGMTKAEKTVEGFSDHIAKVSISKSTPATPVMIEIKTNPHEKMTGSEVENQIEYLEKLRIDLANDYNFEDVDQDARFKRYDFYYDDKATFDPLKRETLTKSNYYDKFKKRFFEKKATPKSTSEKIDLRDILIPSNDKLHRDMEITIINLDDFSKKYENDKDLDSEVRYHTSVKDEETKSSNTKTTLVPSTKSMANTNSIVITKKPTQQTQNEASYDKMFQELNRMINRTEKPKDDKDVSSFKNFFTPNEDDSFRYTVTTTPAVPPGIKPKRIQISSHCYKYDIFYDSPRFKIKNEQNSLSTPAFFTEGFRQSTKHSDNEEGTLGNARDGWLGIPRQVREANPTIRTSKHNLNSKSPEGGAEQKTLVAAKERGNLLNKFYFLTKMHDKFKYFVKDSNSTETDTQTTKAAVTSSRVVTRLKDLDANWDPRGIPDMTTKVSKNLLKTKAFATDTKEIKPSIIEEKPSTAPEHERKASVATTKAFNVKDKPNAEPTTSTRLQKLNMPALKASKTTQSDKASTLSMLEKPLTTTVTRKQTANTPDPRNGTTRAFTPNSVTKAKSELTTNARNKIADGKQEKIESVTEVKKTSIQNSKQVTPDSSMKLLSASQLEAQGIHMIPKNMTEGETFYIEPGAYDEVKHPHENQEQTSMSTLLTGTELEAMGINLVPKPTKTETFYVESGAYDDHDKVYYETEMLKKSSSAKPKHTTPYDKLLERNKIDKRDVQLSSTYTAKDVAALEVIVDLMKNTQAYEEATLSRLLKQNENIADGATNAIQVHIAIPCDLQNGKKRCLDPVRIRKVFSAKMSSPVDLEYQVHSYDNVAETTRFEEMLSPGLYLLINDGTSLPKGHFALKPIQSTVSLSNIQMREAVTPQKYEVIDTTSATKVSKVTLSKDFVSAINKHLVQLYEHLTAINETKRQTKDHREKRFVKSSLESIKKYFGHDRVCACKCKPNRTMCRACAASDSVMSELVFEFENLANYMKDHCTEIQTFFWMNPSGGKQLTEAVHKIDRNLKDYYKSVKNKCKGRTCNSFATAIDKRAFNHDKVEKDYIGPPMVKDLISVASVLKLAARVNCYNESLKEKSDKLVGSFNTCMATKNLEKRSTFVDRPKGKLCKNVYSLDNINVNIICHPESSTYSTYSETNPKNKSDKRMFDYVIDGLKKKRKGNRFRKFFSKNEMKQKWFTYIDDNVISTEKSQIKRQADGFQIESPLTADTGGSFWLNYIKGNQSTKEDTKKNSNNVSTTEVKKASVSMNTPTTTNQLMSKKLPNKQKTFENMLVSSETSTSSSDMAVGEDSLTDNINELLKLFGSLADLEDSKVKYSGVTTTTELARTKTKEKTKSSKTKKTTKPHKHTKTTITHSTRKKAKSKHKPAKNATEPPVFNFTVTSSATKLTDTLSTQLTSTESPTTVSITELQPTTEKQISVDLTKYTENVSEKPNVFDKIKMGTISLLGKFYKNYQQTTQTTTTDSRHVRTADTMTIEGVNVDSNITSTTNPTILIINEYGNIDVNGKNPNLSNSGSESDKISDLLLSIIQHETNKLNDEWVRVADKQVQERHTPYAFSTDMTDLPKAHFNITIAHPNVETADYILKDAFVNFVKKTTTKATKPSSKSTSTSVAPKKTENASGDYDILKIIHNLEIPEPVASKSAKSKGFFDKIASKIGVKVVHNKKKKAVKRTTAKMTTLNAQGGTAKTGVGSKEPADTESAYREANEVVSESLHEETESNKIKNEACDTHPVSKLCDLRATFNHILDLYHNLSIKDFESYVRNVKCYKYKRPPKVFLIKSVKNGEEATKKLKWDWIRDKRSLIDSDYGYIDDGNVILKEIHYDRDDKVNDEDETNANNARTPSLDISRDVRFKIDDGRKTTLPRYKNLVEYNGFETYNRDKNGIYSIRKKRDKRTICSKQAFGLKNLPRLRPASDEIYIMLGDSLTVSCKADDRKHTAKYRTSDPGVYTWRSDRSDMLNQYNVAIDGPKVTIKDIQPKNVGNYYCNKDNRVMKNMKLSVVTLPCFRVISTPLYASDDGCTYDDDGRSQMKAAVIMSLEPHAQLACSVQCRRDLHASIALLHALNMKTLFDVSVVIQYPSGNKTLTPAKGTREPIVTHTLRTKDANRSVSYYKLASNMAPGDVMVVAVCPAGYYLIPEQKICATCPRDTSSSLGDNACAVCPRGTQAGPGADTCTIAPTRLRRYDWWWYPPCGYCVACGVVVCACGACAVLAVIGHLASRGGEPRGGRVDTSHAPAGPGSARCRKHTRPLSPSRVILARFFRPSLSSARATDSQETKFEQWKERNIPPPLPPIDFDL